ncbi:Aspartyl aminopeptidase [Schistosoma japonicum]|nr:Aspartyl aminopeptidase [Schistosoma japonicum]
MTQPQPSDINRDLPLNPQTQNTTNHSNPNSNLFTSAPEEQEKCDFPSPHFCEQDSKFQWNSVQEPSGVSPLSSPSILETHLGRECVTERTSDTDTKNSSSPITFGSPFSPSTSLNSQLHCIPTTVYSNAITSVTTITSVRRPRHKPAERRELLELAVNDVLGSQISMRRAAQKYNLAKSSLCDYVRKNGIILPNLRFKSYQTIPRSTATDLSVSNRKITLSANTSRQTPGSCKRSGSPLVGNVCTSSVSSLPTKLSCGITRKVNITRMKNMDNTKQHPKISAKPIIHMNNLSLGMDNSRAASIASTCDVNSIRPLTLCDRTGNDSCPSEICLPVHHHANNQGNLFNLSNISKCLTNVISCKAGRIESPWHNAAGLPTQVPMRPWMGPNTLSGSLQNANRQDQQQPINMRSLSSFIASSSGIVSGQLHCDQEDSMTNNDSLTKTKLNHASLSVNMNTPFQSTNNYLNALTENSNESLTDCSQGSNHFLPNETKSLGDKISSRQNFLLFGDCCCPANLSDTNFPADSPSSHLSSEYDRRIFLNEESTRSLVCNNSNRNLNGLSDSEQSRSILDNTHSLRTTYESSSTRISCSSPSSTVTLDSSSSNLTQRFLNTPLSLPSFNCQNFPIDITKHPPKTTCSISDNTNHISLQSESASNSTAASALCSFLGLGSVNHINSRFCQPSASVFQPNLFPINQAALAALLLQYSRTAVAATVTPAVSTDTTTTSYANYSVVTSPLSSSQLQNSVDLVQNSLNQSNQIDKSFNQAAQSIPLTQLPFSTRNHFNNSELINSLSLCDQQINLLKQLPKFLIESGIEATSPPTELVIPPHLTNQSAAQSLRQLATTLFWSSLGSKAVDLLSTIGSDIFQQQQQQANTSNSSNFPIIHTTTLTPTSVAVTKCGVNNFPIDLLNNNITSNQVNFCRNTESVKVHRPTPSISSTASPALLLNSDLLKNQLLSLHSSNSNMSYHVQGLINFINKSPTPFHVIQLVRTFLGTHGFRELLEDEPWTLRPLDKVYVTKNESTVIVAAVGGRFETGNGFTLLGAHTDSPCLRLKPNSERLKEGYIQLGVETYGGGLWYTWFDRELTLAGRVIIRNSEGRLEQRLVHINNPIACVPSLAIHLNQEIKTQGFHPNSEQHLSPILCTSLMEQLQNPTVQSLSTTDCVSDSTNTCFNLCPVSLSERHHHPPALLRLLSEETGVSEQQIVELELYFADAQPACVGGLYKEFIHAPRLDNLFNSYAGLHGFIESLPTLSSECNMRLLCLFDHEEVGSTSTQGADSGYTLSVIRRLCKAFEMSSTSNIPTSNNPNTPHSKYNLDLNFEQSLAKSFLVSADQAHAVHPSWSERHECYHKPQFHGGVVLKYNVSQRYATNGLTAAVVREIAHLSNVPVQEFVARQDMHCGSTIGPLLSSQLGVPTVDLGFPQLAMHSCRELCCSSSVEQAVRFYSSYYEHLSKIWCNQYSLRQRPPHQSYGPVHTDSHL